LNVRIVVLAMAGLAAETITDFFHLDDCFVSEAVNSLIDLYGQVIRRKSTAVVGDFGNLPDDCY
jgi:hypothetical protein